ncbi:MAG: hypothetical protein JXC32_08065 [Anaerolineae bacterium]|nr:hypothetical protein [Anaerolineae bacterium]
MNRSHASPPEEASRPEPGPMSTTSRPKQPLQLLGLIAAGIVVGGGAFLSLRRSMPVQLLSHYPVELLAAEAGTMVECGECHESEDFHACATCHDDHGAIEFEEVPFYAVITFAGDVPDPGFILIDDILPYRDQPHTHIPLLVFLENQGVTDFESVTMTSDDGGFITVERDQLSEEALLLPYEDGIRFADENLHVSAWIKGISGIIVVGQDRPLLVEGEATSIGRLLRGPTRSVTVEETEVKFKREETGQVRTARTASRLEGAPLEDILASRDFTAVTVRTQDGETMTLSTEDARGALLANLREDVTLILPDRARNEWIRGVVGIASTP